MNSSGEREKAVGTNGVWGGREPSDSRASGCTAIAALAGAASTSSRGGALLVAGRSLHASAPV